MICADDFLEVYDLTLTAKSPVFIGDGGLIRKKYYHYDERSGMVSIFQEQKLFELLVAHHLVDAYEEFMMNNTGTLDFFLKNKGHLSAKEWNEAVAYSTNAKGVLDAGHSLKDIHTFVRNAAGNIYVPGSSIKGALRTVLLNKMILDDSEPRNAAYYAEDKFDNELEARYLNQLDLNKKKSDAVNSLMRGIQISDSMPIPDQNMILTMKKDAHVDGTFGRSGNNSRSVVCRESLRPGTTIKLKLTLDQSVLHHKITKEKIEKAIFEYDRYYRKMYLSHFKPPASSVDVFGANCMILGGGAGFFSKTLVYPYYGYEEGLRKTAEMMKAKFNKHHHDRDVEKGISPHTMEYSRFQGKLYQMGICEVKIS